MGLDGDGLGGEKTLNERIDRAGILPTGGLGVPPQQGDKIRAEGVDVPFDETFRRVGDGSAVMIDGECGESRSVGVPELERGVAVPSLSKSFDHGVIGLLRDPARLIIHDVDQTTWSMLKKSKAFGVVEVRNAGDMVGDSFSRVLWNVVLEKAFLNEILESFVGEVDAELVEGIGRAGHVLWSREIE